LHDIDDAVQYLQDPKIFKKKIVTIHEKYASSKDILTEEKSKTNNEKITQVKFLESTVLRLANKNKENSEINKSNYNKMVRENMTLLTELNSTRKKLKKSNESRKHVENILKLQTKLKSKDIHTILDYLRNESSETNSLAKKIDDNQRLEYFQQTEIKRLQEKLSKKEQSESIIKF